MNKYPELRFQLIGLLALITIVLPACKKVTSFPETASNVYIAGTSAYSGMLWNNGISVTLTSDSISSANAIFVNGSDVYIAGAVFVNGFGNIPVYWKNGQANFLTVPDPSGLGYLNAINVSGSTVYVAGATGNQSPGYSTYAVLWTNGTPSYLDSIPYLDSVQTIPCSANSITVSGNNILAAGYGSSGACYWMNGKETGISAAPNTIASSVASSGTDIYVTGEIADSNYVQAAYWKDGNAVSLPSSGGGNSQAHDIYLSGTDVYACGNQSINGFSVAIYWKDGVATILETAPGNSDANSIFVNGSDVYVAGFSNQNACYWKNGTVYILGSTAVANSVFVN
jgi:hypothetical protein